MGSCFVSSTKATVSAFFAALWAAKLLCGLGLGIVAQTKQSEAGGKPSWFFVKKQVCAKARAVLTVLGFSDASTPTMAWYAAVASREEDLPPRAATINWGDFTFPTEATYNLALMHLLQNKMLV